MTATLKDIADNLKISVGTVSRALNGTGRISGKTRQLVLKEAARVDYKPDDAARTLKKKSANVIGVIVPDISNNFFANVIKGVEDSAYSNKYSVLVCNSNSDPVKETEYVKLLLQKHVKGIVIASVGGGETSLLLRQQCTHSAATAVFIDNIPPDCDAFDVVTIDNVKAAYDITAVLIEHGYTKIAAITGPVSQSTAAERLEGFKKRAVDAGITVDSGFIAEGDFNIESGFSIMKGWLEAGARPEALFAANNFLAYGAVNAIFEQGLRIPEDIAVICFDAVDDTGLIRPKLTTVVQPAVGIGSVAADIVMENRTMRRESERGKRIVLTPEFIFGESVKYSRGD